MCNCCAKKIECIAILIVQLIERFQYKYLFILLSACLILAAFTGYDKESDFENRSQSVSGIADKKRKIFYKICFLNKSEYVYFILEVIGVGN